MGLTPVMGHLSRLVRFNAPLVPGIEAAMKDAPGRWQWRILSGLRDALNQGCSLSDAMRQQPRVFPRYYVDLVRAGEASGTLGDTLATAMEMRQDWAPVKRYIFDILLYVLVVFGTGFILALFISVYILPIFLEILAGYGYQAPAPIYWITNSFDTLTDSIKGLGRFVTGSHDPQRQSDGFGAGMLVSGSVGGIALATGLWFRQKVLSASRRVASRVPFFGRIISHASLGHAAAILQRLIAAGYPLDEALDSAAQSDISPNLAAAFRRMRDRVRQGESLAEAAKREKGVLPELFQTFVGVGEVSANLDEWLGGMSHFYHRQFMKSARVAVDVVFPIIIVAMGCLVLLVYSSVFLALVSLADGMIASI